MRDRRHLLLRSGRAVSQGNAPTCQSIPHHNIHGGNEPKNSHGGSRRGSPRDGDDDGALRGLYDGRLWLFLRSLGLLRSRRRLGRRLSGRRSLRSRRRGGHGRLGRRRRLRSRRVRSRRRGLRGGRSGRRLRGIRSDRRRRFGRGGRGRRSGGYQVERKTNVSIRLSKLFHHLGSSCVCAGSVVRIGVLYQSPSLWIRASTAQMTPFQPHPPLFLSLINDLRHIGTADPNLTPPDADGDDALFKTTQPQPHSHSLVRPLIIRIHLPSSTTLEQETPLPPPYRQSMFDPHLSSRTTEFPDPPAGPRRLIPEAID